MNNIIVGFDFSAGSAIAVDLAIDIANRWQNDIRLVYVKTSANEDEGKIREEIERRNAAVESLLKGIKLEYVLRVGKVSHELVEQAKEDNASLVIVGTNGMSGYKKNWIGRNTYATITESHVPVLCIREGFNFNKALEDILVPLDSTLSTRQKVPVAAKFAAAFGSKIHILALYSSSSNSSVRGIVNNYVLQVDKFLYSKGIQHDIERKDVDNKNVTDVILKRADEINADMIVIMTEQESAISEWLLGSTAEQMLHLSTRPVLSIRPEDEALGR